MAQNTAEIWPSSRTDGLPKIDGRRREAKLMHATRARLIAHCGGNPSAAQLALISGATMLTVRLAQLDRKVAAGQSVDDERYARMNNTMIRIMARLGLQAPAPRSPTLAEYLTAKAEAGAAA